MVKFSSKLANGKTLVGLGIVKYNVAMLMSGRPMSIPLSHVIEEGGGVKAEDIQIMIFYGETEEAIKKDMAEFIDSQTHVVDHRKPAT